MTKDSTHSEKDHPVGVRTTSLLEARNVSAAFPRQQPLFSHVSLFMRATTHTIIKGGNGAGKSTLLRILAGLHTPTTGTVIRNPGTRIGYLSSAHPGMYADLSLNEHLNLLGISLREDLLGEPSVSLPPRLRSAPTRRLSSGELSLVGFAYVLAQSPQVLLLDELSAHLDERRDAFISMGITNFCRAGGAVISVTHDAVPKTTSSTPVSVFELTREGLRSVAAV